MTTRPLRFGVFYAPFHPLGQDPTLALEYDLERVVELDRVGFDEAWFGEHHSGGYEIIGCPEIFIAVAAERTKHIKLGTGVVSLPYHHPWLVADRIVLLDHLTRGRVMFGTGPGALPSDAFVMGIDPVDQRRRMEESLEAVSYTHLDVYKRQLMYLTRWYRADDALETPPAPKLGGDLGYLKFLIVPGDGGMLSATLAVGTEDKQMRRLLSEPDRFERACRSLPGPDQWFGELDLEPIGGIRPMGGLMNRIRRFTDASGRPTVRNFHAVGDAHTCTNPLYGRGCSLALLQAVLLADAMEAHDDPTERATAYEASCREEVAPWWHHAVEIDRSGADTADGDAPDQAQRDRLAAVMAASQTDPVIGRGMARLWNLLTRPADLNAEPEFVARVGAIMADPDAYPAPDPTGPSRQLLLDGLAA